MKWKVGDKVRLVGGSWSPPDSGRWRRGTQHTVTGVCEGKVRLGEKNYYWHLGRGWEIELVERKEENMIDISDVNVGDRVKLTHENGDELTFIVTYKGAAWLGTEYSEYYPERWKKIEIVERAEPPFEPYWGMTIKHPTEKDSYAMYFPDEWEYGSAIGEPWVYTVNGEYMNSSESNEWAKRKLAEGWVVIEKPEGVK